MRLRALLPFGVLVLLQACGQGRSDDIRDKVLAAPEKGLCALDSLNGKDFGGGAVDVRAGEALTFVGWAADSNKKPPSTVTVVLQNDKTGVAVEGKLGAARADVAQSLNAPELANSGFTASAQPALGGGSYSVVLLLKGSSRDERCDTRRTVNVR